MSLYGIDVRDYEDRFWAKVDKTETCWKWTGCLNKQGYGAFYIMKRTFTSHRLSLSMFLGRELTTGLDVAHSCGNRWCVNPSHLREDTREGNCKDTILHGRTARGTKAPSNKLSEEDVKNIRKDLDGLKKDYYLFYGKAIAYGSIAAVIVSIIAAIVSKYFDKNSGILTHMMTT
jgi:hypothetical protein